MRLFGAQAATAFYRKFIHHARFAGQEPNVYFNSSTFVPVAHPSAASVQTGHFSPNKSERIRRFQGATGNVHRRPRLIWYVRLRWLPLWLAGNGELWRSLITRYSCSMLCLRSGGSHCWGCAFACYCRRSNFATPISICQCAFTCEWFMTRRWHPVVDASYRCLLVVRHTHKHILYIDSVMILKMLKSTMLLE